MSEISKEDLKKEIVEILKDADLDNTSAKKVRIQLQEKLDVDLTERKKEVDQLVMEVIDEQTQEEDEEEEEEEEEEPAPKKKPAPKPKKRAQSESGSEFEAEDEKGSDEEAAPSDGGGSDYEPDAPVKVGRGKAKNNKKVKYGSDDESSGEEWGGKKKTASAKKGRKKKADSDDSDYEKPKKKKRAPGKAGGYTAPVKLSEELADIVGGSEMPRHEVVKRMWAYIKENKLQDPKNKQMIKCDEKLEKVIPTKKFRGFGMTKFLKDHMNVEGGKAKPASKKKADSGSEDSD